MNKELDKINFLLKIIREEKVTAISFLFAIVSILFVKIDAEYLTYININTIMTLFILMFIVNVIKGMNIFYMLGVWLVKKVSSIRIVFLILVMLCFFSSMLITNDVALITFVPFAIEVIELINKKQYMIIVIVLMTIAANMGSAITPIGNPQNIYLYSISKMGLVEFFNLMLPYMIVTLFLLVILNFILIKNDKISANIDNGSFGKIDLVSAIKNVDYFLLLTFIFLFIFIGNMSRIPAISNFLKNIISGREVLVSILSSQVISNVPAAILLSKFTNDYKGLIIGTNFGGLGTLIASMASLISFKFYSKSKNSDVKNYIIDFSIYNVLFLVVLIVVYFVWCNIFDFQHKYIIICI